MKTKKIVFLRLRKVPCTDILLRHIFLPWSSIDRWLKMRQYFLLVLFVFILAGCKQHSGFVVSTPDVTPICTLQENLGLLGRVTSFDRCDDSSFVLISSGNSNIYTYSMAGAQKQCLNKSGRALYEYVTPKLVRADGEGNLYLWCSDSQQFISYDAAGTPRLAFKYPSAVYDFLPLSDQVLAVYTAGRRHGNVIDLLDGNNGTVLDTLVQSSEAHYMLTSALGRGAMSLSDKGRFVFMPKDALTVYEVPADRGRPEKSAVFQSPTFSCEPMETSFNGDIQKLLKFLNTTPSTLLVMKKGRTIWVLTQEGAVKENNGAGGKYYSLYKLHSGKLSSTWHYMWKDLTTPELFAVYRGGIYFIRMKPGSDGASWELCRWDLPS